MSLFASTGLSAAVLTALQNAGFHTPTPVQSQAIPAALSGKDVIGVARTGTGKTLAFGLPILELLNGNTQRALILVPTRELAIQVEESLNGILRRLPTNIRTVCIIGGTSIYNQASQLRRNPRIVIATPGRLRDHVERRNIYLADYSRLVLDEADRMLDMGFLPEIKRILAELPAERQTLLFSATFSNELTQLVAKFMREPVRVEVSPSGTTATEIKQELCYVEQSGKPKLLRKYLEQHSGPVLVFARTRRGAGQLKSNLERDGFQAAEIHSDRSLQQRRAALNGFKSGRFRILVATDIAARGIDVDSIELVVNYDLPEAAEDYVHRIGRTGRAGKSGLAVSFATHDQYTDVRDIERLVKLGIPLSDDSEPMKARPSYQDRPRNRRFQRRGNPRHQGGGRQGGRSNSGFSARQ
jgi:ATP-dependent RNA helicase RhlE